MSFNFFYLRDIPSLIIQAYLITLEQKKGIRSMDLASAVYVKHIFFFFLN